MPLVPLPRLPVPDAPRQAIRDAPHLVSDPPVRAASVGFLLAILVWFIYHFVGIKNQGFFGYIKSACVPPGVPKAILPLVFFIELIGILVTRPLSFVFAECRCIRPGRVIPVAEPLFNREKEP